MSNFSDFLERKVIGATLLGSTYTSIDTIFVGLITTLTTVTTEPNFTEVTTNVGYARQRVFFTEITSEPDMTVLNTGLIAFPQATASWDFVAHFGIFDGPTIGGGNLLYWGDRPGGAQEIVSGDNVEIPNGELTVRLD